MSLVLHKTAQLSMDGTDIAAEDIIPLNPDVNMADDMLLLADEDSEPGILLELDDDSMPELMLEDPGDEVVLTLDKIPGAMDQDDIVEEPELEVEEEKEVEVHDDPWGMPAPSMFLPWLSNHMQNCPSHTGRDSTGLERAVAHFERLKPYISRAIRSDVKNEIDIVALEKARDEIHQALERLSERLEQVHSSKYRKGKKKKADVESDDMLVKEAQKAWPPSMMVVTVPLFISSIARVLINGMVSAGHDIEDMFKKLDKKWKFDPREKAELFQLLADMGYAVRRDRGFMADEEIDTRSVDNFDWMANYPA